MFPNRSSQKGVINTHQLKKSCLVLCILLLLGGCQENAQMNPEPSFTLPEKTYTSYELQTLADQGDAEAQYVLGSLYLYGKGVRQDYKKAVEWYTKSAKQGYPAGQGALGKLYDAGLGVKQSYSEAAKWYLKAAEQGVEEAQCNIGQMYLSGQGVKQNYAEAEQWLTKAAEHGSATAQLNLGSMYYHGDGVKQDYKKAEILYTRSAEQGFAAAQYNLGVMYYYGRGVSVNRIEGYKWILLAEKNGFDVDKTKQLMEDEITPDQLAEAQKKMKEFISK